MIKILKVFVLAIVTGTNAFTQEKSFFLNANGGFHLNTTTLSSIRIIEEGIGRNSSTDGKVSAASFHYDFGAGYQFNKKLYASVSLGKYALKHVHDFQSEIGEVGPRIKLEQRFYQARLVLGYQHKLCPKWNVDFNAGVRLLRGKNRIVPDFRNSANSTYYRHGGYTSNTFDSAKVAVSVNFTDLFGVNLVAGSNIGYTLNQRLSVYAGLFFEYGLRSMITTGAHVKEYATDNAGVTSERTTPQVAISDGSGVGFNIGIRYNLK